MPDSFAPALSPLDKGAPGDNEPVPLSDIGRRGWNVLREDFPLPLAVLKESALQNNGAWMRKYLASTGARIAPHGKTTLAPELFDRQIADGAWGITVATPHQIRVARAFGHRRIFVANQIIGRKAIEYLVQEMQSSPDLEIYSLCDSLDHMRELERVAELLGAQFPIRLLVEVGFKGGRTGCRRTEEAVHVAQAIAASKHLALYGVEGFEGVAGGASPEILLSNVRELLDRVVTVAEECSAKSFFAEGKIILSAGGSAFFDLVADAFHRAKLSRAPLVLIRSGCYLTHDASMYKRAFALLTERIPHTVAELGELQPALEIWAYVQSRPEPTRVIASLGKRDISYDEMPIPLKWHRPSLGESLPLQLPQSHRTVRLDDQHCYLDVPEESPLRVGDMVAFGMSHPCLTFDKWRVIHRVDDNYGVLGSLRTYF